MWIALGGMAWLGIVLLLARFAGGNSRLEAQIASAHRREPEPALDTLRGDEELLEETG